MADLDGDLVPNLWEYELRDRRKSPDNPYDTYGFDLVVSLNWDADDEYIDKLEKGMRLTSSLLFDTTDGYFLIKSVIIHSNNVAWDTADILLYQGDQVPDSIVGWLLPHYEPYTITFGRRVINMPEKFKAYTDSEERFEPEKYQWCFALAHELGHYKLRLWDEYKAMGMIIPEEYRVCAIISSLPGYKELSTHYDYVDAWEKIMNKGANLIYMDTDQIVFGGGPCWKKVFDDWNYFSGCLIANQEIERGLQFDLDQDNFIDLDYYIEYCQSGHDEFNPVGLYYDEYYYLRNKYPIGNFLRML